MASLTLKDQPMRMGLESDQLALLIFRIAANRKTRGDNIFEACCRAEAQMELSQPEGTDEMTHLRHILEKIRDGPGATMPTFSIHQEDGCGIDVGDGEDGLEPLPPSRECDTDDDEETAETESEEEITTGYRIWRPVSFFMGG